MLDLRMPALTQIFYVKQWQAPLRANAPVGATMNLDSIEEWVTEEYEWEALEEIFGEEAVQTFKNEAEGKFIVRLERINKSLTEVTPTGSTTGE